MKDYTNNNMNNEEEIERLKMDIKVLKALEVYLDSLENMIKESKIKESKFIEVNDVVKEKSFLDEVRTILNESKEKEDKMMKEYTDEVNELIDRIKRNFDEIG